MKSKLFVLGLPTALSIFSRFHEACRGEEQKIPLEL